MPTRTMLITGGTSGIGLATAQLALRRGDRVIATGRRPESVSAAQRTLGDGALVLRADSGSRADTDRVAETVAERFGALDALFLNAGINRPRPVADVDEATFEEQVRVNFQGPFFMLQALLALIVDGGAVVLTVGTGVRSGINGSSVGVASKGALLALIPSLALELAPRRIRVNAVSPGAIETPMWDDLGVGEEARAQLSATIPFGRFGTPSEVAEAVLFLASEKASYITGQEIAVGGGVGLG